MTLNEVINRIQLVVSQTKQEPANSAFLDTSVLTEVLLPRVFTFVVANAVKDENQLSALRQNHTLTFTDGVATLPETIKEKYADSIYVVDADSGSFSNASYKRHFLDYATGTNNFCAKFTVQNRQVLYRNGGQPSGAFAGSLTINAITLPTLPSTVSTAVDLKDHLLEEVISICASVIQGQIPLANFGLDNGGK